MADEIQLQVSLSVSKGGAKSSIALKTIKVDMAGDNFVNKTQTIATSAEAIEVGDISTLGWLIVGNLDATNFVQIGIDSGGFVPFVNLKAAAAEADQEWAVFRLTPGITLQAQADTAATLIQYMLIED